MKYMLRCTSCGTEFGSSYDKQICKKCSGILEVNYRSFPLYLSQAHSFWDYESMLPDGKYNRYEVGLTKMIRSKEYGLYFKTETENPTRSFKDRGSVIEVAKAAEYGYKEIACASTGNMAYSIAYYAKLYGIKTKVFISDDANKDKLRNIKETHDADVVKVDGDFTKAQKLAESYAKKNNSFLAGDYCYRKEGQSTIAYEVLSQMPDLNYLILPVGNATLIGGVLKAFHRIKDIDPKAHIPTVVGVQSTTCKPFVDAVSRNRKVKYVTPETKADAIAVGLPTFGQTAAEELLFLGGSVIAVTDKEMLQEQKSFYSDYGIIAELAGVASIAAFRKLKMQKNEKAVALISGGNV